MPPAINNINMSKNFPINWSRVLGGVGLVEICSWWVLLFLVLRDFLLLSRIITVTNPDKLEIIRAISFPSKVAIIGVIRLVILGLENKRATSANQKTEAAQ